MRFGLVHRIATDALAALGVLAIVSTASLSPWTNIVLVVGMALAIAIPERWHGRPWLRHFATAAPAVLLLVQAIRLALGRSPLDVAVEFAALLQIVRLATRRGAAHDHQIIVLAMLHFVAGTVLGGGLTYGICFVGFLVVAPGALVLSHLRREVEGNYRQGARDRTGLPVDVPRILRSRRVVGRGFLAGTCLLAIPILLFTTILFIIFPRIGLSLLLLSHPHAGRMIGFSEHVNLGDVGVLRDDPTIALRFELPDMPDPAPSRLTLRLRGTAFDGYDGHAWARTLHEPAHAVDYRFDGIDTYSIFRAPDVARDRRIAFDLESIDPPVVFVPARAVAVRIRASSPAVLGEPVRIQHGPEDELRYTSSDARGLRYDVFLANGDELLVERMLPDDRARYLQLPADFPERIGELAHRWTDAVASPEAKAAAIEAHLRHDFVYDLHSPSAGKPQPVDDFLFESHRGHCEFFSTAMALLLRTVGIPSRNVTGFVGGTWNRFGRYYAVREGDAHSWVEAYIDDSVHPGWRTFDPTPARGAQPLEPPTGVYYYLRDFVDALSQRWNTYVVGYDVHKQMRLFEDVAQHYERMRARAGVDKGALDKWTRAPAAAALLLGLIMVGYSVWKRRRRKSDRGGDSASAGSKLDANVESAVALFRDLETALRAHGIHRAASMPPLRHAEQLRQRSHPLGDEVVDITRAYLEVRFGGVGLTDERRRSFEKRIRVMRNVRRATATA